MRLERWRFSGGRLRRERSLVDGIEAGRIHDSGRIALRPRRPAVRGHRRRRRGRARPTGRLAERQVPGASRPRSTAVRAGGPRSSRSGHRNPQGFDWEPGTGRLIATEHGPSEGVDGPEGYDEINEIRQGGNYGWPRVYGFEQAGFNAPLHVYRQPLAPSGGTFVSRPGSSWTGSFVFACAARQAAAPAGLQGRAHRRRPSRCCGGASAGCGPLSKGRTARSTC